MQMLTLLDFILTVDCCLSVHFRTLLRVCVSLVLMLVYLGFIYKLALQEDCNSDSSQRTQLTLQSFRERIPKEF